MKHVSSIKKITMPADASINASVDIGPTSKGFGIAVKLVIHLPGMEKSAAQDLINAAHQVCPYSNATRDNIEVELILA